MINIHKWKILNKLHLNKHKCQGLKFPPIFSVCLHFSSGYRLWPPHLFLAFTLCTSACPIMPLKKIVLIAVRMWFIQLKPLSQSVLDSWTVAVGSPLTPHTYSICCSHHDWECANWPLSSYFYYVLEFSIFAYNDPHRMWMVDNSLILCQHSSICFSIVKPDI